MKNKKYIICEILKRGFVGMGCASLFCTLLTLIEYKCGVDFSELGVVGITYNQIAYSIVGFALGATGILFNTDRFSTLTATLIHFAIVLSVYIAAGFIGGWFRAWGVKLLIPVACFLGTYAVTWLSIYILIKRSADKINKKLSEKQKHE